MNLLVLDAEFNQPSGKTIQIGAIAVTVAGRVLEGFNLKVNPHEPILPEITKLTGITDDMVSGAPDIAEAYDKLKTFAAEHGCFMNPVVWGSGIRNDSSTIYEQSGSLEPNFMGYRVLDAKTVYQTSMIFQSGRTVRGGLEKSLKALGLEWDGRLGQPHDALADAFNTARIYFHLAANKKISI